MKARTATLHRKTRETDIWVRLNLDGQGRCKISTGLPFLDHMLELAGKNALVDLEVSASGDLQVDYHHTVEDLGLAIGQALDQALGERRGIVRYGWAMLPMDEALSMVAVDLGGRASYVSRMACRKKKILDFDLGLFREFFQGFTAQGRLNVHVWQMYGDEAHHAYESVFKGLGRALRAACERDARAPKAIPSTKGTL